MVLEQNYTRSAAFKSLGVNPNILGRWITAHEEDDGHAFRGNGVLTPDQYEIRKLKSQVKYIEIEREILKKSTVFFAKEMK